MPDLVSQPTAAPTRKVASGTFLGAPAGAVVVAMLARWLDLDVTPDEAAVLGSIVGALVSQGFSYFTREAA